MILYYAKSYIFLILIYNIYKASNGKVKLETSRLWQLDHSWGKPCQKG